MNKMIKNKGEDSTGNCAIFVNIQLQLQISYSILGHNKSMAGISQGKIKQRVETLH